ncbi:MAG: hypothetical protein EHM55_24645, partial [Acidobacteria bacterium]
MRLWSSLSALVFLAAATPHAQSTDRDITKRATIIRVAEGAIRVDGRLDDRAWDQAVALSDFTQKEPVEGAAPTERMEVMLAYDADALYVGARMYSRDPSAIQAPLGRR